MPNSIYQNNTTDILSIDIRNNTANYCLQCGKPTKNPKFCCRHCSALFANKVRKQETYDKQKASLTKTLIKKYNNNPKECFTCGKYIPFSRKKFDFCCDKCASDENQLNSNHNKYKIKICRCCGLPKSSAYPLHVKLCKTKLISQRSENLKKLGFNFDVFGTTGIFIEYEKIKTRLHDEYYNQAMSIPNLLVKYNIPSERSFIFIFDLFEIKCRSISESQITYNTNIGIYANKTEREIYFSKCDFKFGFALKLQGFELISQYGVYDPLKNPCGISRDHLISKVYGWEHKIPTEIISSPANCVYVFQSDNASKSTKCAITEEELYERYKLWQENKPLPILDSNHIILY